MNYRIIATLGPSSSTESIWSALLASGAISFRLNTSHLSLPQLRQWLDRLSPFLASLHPVPPLVLDLQGSKWRLGNFSPFDLQAEQTVELVYASTAGQPGILPVPHLDFFKAASVSSPDLSLNDAKITLRIQTIQPERIAARVVQAGPIAPNKGLTFVASDYRQENLGQKDLAIIEQTCSLEFIHYAISYIKDAQEMSRYRLLLGTSAFLVAKLERQPALEDAVPIAAVADELWLCRGDLGAELGLKAMAEQVHQFPRIVSGCPKPVLMAGQVLEHMTEHASPTRSEICFLYDTLLQGYQGFVLSDETAIGRYPMEACQAAALFMA